MKSDEEKALFWAMLAQLIAEKIKKSKKEVKKISKDDVLNRALNRTRILAGSSMMRSGRPMTDILKKIKKKQRRAILGEFLKYRSKNVKGPQKSMVTNTRKQAVKAYKKK